VIARSLRENTNLQELDLGGKHQKKEKESKALLLERRTRKERKKK
jgi:hypothetical protein